MPRGKVYSLMYWFLLCAKANCSPQNKDRRNYLSERCLVYDKLIINFPWLPILELSSIFLTLVLLSNFLQHRSPIIGWFPTPSWNWTIYPQDMLMWYHGKAYRYMSHLFPYIPIKCICSGCPKINFTFLKFCSFKSKPHPPPPPPLQHQKLLEETCRIVLILNMYQLVTS